MTYPSVARCSRATDRVSDFATAPSEMLSTWAISRLPEPVTAKVHALSIPFGQRVQHRDRPPPMFAVRQLRFGIVPGIGQPVRGMVVGVKSVALLPLPGPSLQRHVVRDSEEPPLQVRSSAAPAEMPEQGKKHVLDEVFAVADGDAERTDIAKERIAQLVEERKHLPFNFRGARDLRRSNRGKPREVYRRLGGGSIHCANPT